MALFAFHRSSVVKQQIVWLRFIMAFIIIIFYLFVRDDLFTNERFTTRTEQLNTCKCCYPLQKLRARLVAVKAVS